MVDIFKAIEDGNLNLIKDMLKHNPEIIHIQGGYLYGRMTPKQYAVSKGNKEVFIFFFEGTTDFNAKNKSGKTLMHFIAERGELDIMEYIVSKDGNIHEKDVKGKTPLHYAARKGNLEIVRFLINNKAVVNIEDDKGKIPLHYASYSYSAETVKLLISEGANSKAKDKLGLTPLHYAVYCGNIYSNSRLHGLKKFSYSFNSSRNLETVELLILDKVDIHAKDNDDTTPLHYAAYTGNKYITSLLIENGAISDIHIKTKNSETPLHYAAYGTHEVFELLLKNSAASYIDEKDISGKTALHYAAGNGNLKITKLLLSYDAKFNIKSEEGYTPHEYAIHCRVINRPIKGLLKLYEFISNNLPELIKDNKMLKLYNLEFEDRNLANISYLIGSRLLKADTDIPEFNAILKDKDVVEYLKSSIKENLIKNVKGNIMSYVQNVNQEHLPMIQNIVSKIVTDHVTRSMDSKYLKPMSL